MKKSLTLALAFVALAVFTGLGVAQRKTEEKTGERYGKIDWDYQLMKVKVLEVNESAKTFTVHVAAELQPEKSKQKTWLPNNFKSLPKGGDIIDMWGDPSNLGTGYIYVGNNPIKHSDPSGARWVCFSHPPLLDFRCFDYQPLRTSGKVTQVNEGAKSFTVTANGKQFTFSAKRLKDLPKVEEKIDITYIQLTPAGPMEVTKIKSTKSNASERVATPPK